MGQLSYSIIITLLHSTWQAALLWMFYRVAILAVPHIHPVEKRNATLSLLFSQISISLITFVLSITGISPLSENIFSPGSYLDGQGYWLKNYSGYFLLLYCCAFFFKSMIMVRNWLNFRRFQCRHYQRAPADLKVFTRLKAAEMGIRKNISIWLSPHARSPLTFGFWKPVILLPAALVNQLTTEQAEALILHELSHIKNNDYLLNWFLLFAETIFFFNPFILLAVKEVRKQREFACDIKVLEFAYGPIPYAEALLKTAKLRGVAARFHLAAFQNKDLLLKRIVFFTSVKHENLRQSNLLKAALIPFSILVLLGCLLMHTTGPSVGAEKEVVSHKILINPRDAARSLPENPVPFSTDDRVKSVASEKKTVHPETITAAIAETANEPAAVNDNYYKEDAPETAINLMPVAYEPAADSVREVIVTEENSAGNSVTRSYKVNFKDGKWKMTLLWITVDKKSPDSLIMNGKDSSSATN